MHACLVLSFLPSHMPQNPKQGVEGLFFKLGFPTSIKAVKTVPRPESHATRVSISMTVPGPPGSRDLE